MAIGAKPTFAVTLTGASSCAGWARRANRRVANVRAEPRCRHLRRGWSWGSQAFAEKLLMLNPRTLQRRAHRSVRVNPPGRPKISDRLSLVAEPLLEIAPDFESKKAILHLAALAWNLTVAEGPVSAELLQEILPLLPGPEGEAMFDFLAARMAALFPEEDRIIGKVEIDPCVGTHFDLRVMSISSADNLPASRPNRQRRTRLFRCDVRRRWCLDAGLID